MALQPFKVSDGSTIFWDSDTGKIMTEGGSRDSYYKAGSVQEAQQVWNQRLGNKASKSPGNKSSSDNAYSTPKAPTINVDKIYSEAYNTPEIQAVKQSIEETNAKIQERERALAEAESNINDNPFYSEATRVGKVSKLQQKAGADINNLRGLLNTYEVQMGNLRSDASQAVNVALQQYQIDRQSYQDNVSKFNTLLSSGAIAYANEGDIQAISTALGMSPSMIESIRQKQKQDNVKAQMITSEDDSGNVTVAVIDANTGNIINKQSLGNIAKSKSSSSADTVYGKQVDKYLKDALDILSSEDISTQVSGARTSREAEKIRPDKMLSKQEFENAYSRILGLVGDQELANMLMDRAWSTGGFQAYQW